MGNSVTIPDFIELLAAGLTSAGLTKFE